MADLTGKGATGGGTATGVLPATLGVKTAAGSVSVAPASDGVFTVSLSSASQAPFGIVAKADPFGGLQTTGSLSPLFLDPFDSSLDTTDRWTASGSVPPVVTAGSVVASLGAVNSASSVLVSQPTFNPGGQPFALAGQLTVGSAQSNPNAHRFFGQGVVTSYASATPLTDGFGFEVDLTGALNCVVYIGGTRYVANSTNPALITAQGSWATNMQLAAYSAMTWPATGTAIILLRYYAGAVFFYMAGTAAGFDVPIAVANFTPAVNILPVRFAAITTPAVSTVLATTWSLSGFLLGASGGTNYTNSDPNFPWRQQKVDAQGRAYGVSPDIFVTGVAAQTASGNNVLLTAAGTTSIDTQATGTRSIAIQIVPTGTVSSGVVTFEGSHDNTTFVALPLYDTASLTANPISTVSPATGVSRYFVGSTVYRYIRARISTVIGGGGSIQVFYSLSQATYQPQLMTSTQATAANLNVNVGSSTALTPGTAAANLGKAEDAVAASGDTGLFILGVRRDTLTISSSASGDYNEVATGLYGEALTRDYEKHAKTYSASDSVAAAASATDIFTITGNATTTVYVTKVIVSGIQTTAGLAEVLLVKRSTANTGGTSTAVTAVPHDANDAAASATLLKYTANPTTGTPVGTIRRGYNPIAGATSVVNPLVTYEFGDKGRPIILRGTAQVLAVNLNGVTLTGGTFDVAIEWFEI